MSARAITTALFVILMIRPSLVAADTIELKNGDRVEGTFKQATDAGAVIEVGGQPVTISLDKVSAIYLGSRVEPPKTPCKAVVEAVEPANGSVVRLEQFARIKTGMTYKQVTSILGGPGVESARGVGVVMYTWTNPDGSNMNAMFQNGRLINKAQARLR